MKARKYIPILFALAFVLPLKLAQAAELVFFHSPACTYCEMWRAEVGTMYHKTEEAKRLPIREVNLDLGMPDDLKHLNMPSFTPTFIVMNDDAKEVGRITGYNREFFWEFLAYYLKKMDGEKAS